MQIDSISVIIPAYNEAQRLPITLRRVREYFTAPANDFEIIVVDDGSTDATESEVIKAASEFPGIRLIKNETNRGKGFSVRRGILASTKDLILMTDADLSTPIEEIAKLLPFVQNDFDITIGSRAMAESDLAVRQPWYREGMGKIFNIFVRAMILGGIKDTQCGFKLMRGKAARKVFEKCRIDGFSFDVEALYIARILGYKIKEVPVRWLNSPASRVRIIKDSSRMFLDLLWIRAYGLLGYYE